MLDSTRSGLIESELGFNFLWVRFNPHMTTPLPLSRAMTPTALPFSPVPRHLTRNIGTTVFSASLVIVCLMSLAVPTARAESDEPPKRIDVSSLPATIIDDVVIPVPTEVFGVLDKLGSPNWRDVLRTVKADELSGRPQVALLLGSVIAEGFVAVEAQETEEVKKIGRHVLNLAGAIGVRKSVISRTSSIIDAADKKDWQKVRKELDGASQDVKQAMIELKDEELAQLVSLGGWLRGTEALCQVVAKNYSKDGAELLHQPALLDYFQKRLDLMNPRLKKNDLVKKIQTRLTELRPLIDQNSDVSIEKVNQVHTITAELVKSISGLES
jgi:hypothetical protein